MSYQKKDGRNPHPSFGMTTTQAFRNLFAWRRPFYFNRAHPHLPVLFTMLHPLDEVAPVICRTGGPSNAAKVSFVTETSQKIVFASDEPSLLVTYDRVLGAHSVWTLRRAKPEVTLGYLKEIK